MATTQQTAQQTFNEVLDSLTGYDEARIEGHFGDHILNLLGTNPVKASRALIFTEQYRDGMKSETADENKVVQAAKRHALGLTIKQVNEHFADDEDGDPFGLEDGAVPSTETGKGEPGHESEPVNSPPSAS